MWILESSKNIDENLIETVWSVNRPPFGKHDRIGVRRLILKDNENPVGALVYLPPSGTSARLYTDSEDYDFRIFLANRGFDIFSVDYRTSFILQDETEIAFMTNWGTRMFLDDIREAILFMKRTTGIEKVYLAGHSTGGRYVYLYASERWREDISGMIVLDSAPWESDGPEENNSMDIHKGYAALAQGDTPENRQLFESWDLEAGPHYYDAVFAQFDKTFYTAVGIYYAEGPNAPSPVSGFNTVNDYLAWEIHNVWGPKQLSNVLEGYSSVEMLLAFFMQAAVPYWPLVDYMEEAYMGNWNGKPPVQELRFLDGIGDVDVPLIVFASEEWTTALGMKFWFKYLGPIMVKTSDTEFYLLENFGHLDVLLGEHAKENVFIPLYNWLLIHG